MATGSDISSSHTCEGEFETTSGIREVASYYRIQLEENGWDVDPKIGGSPVYMSARRGGTDFYLGEGLFPSSDGMTVISLEVFIQDAPS